MTITPDSIKKIRKSKEAVCNDFEPFVYDGVEVRYKSNGGRLMPQKKFGRVLGLGEITIGRWERGETEPSAAHELLLESWKHSTWFRYFAELNYASRCGEV